MAKGRRRTTIPAKQLRLPAGYHEGRATKASLKDVIDPTVATVDGDRLTAEQRAKVTLARLAAQRSFVFHTLGRGLLSKARALREVRAGTPLGEALIDIEHRAIRLLREHAAASSSRRTTGRGPVRQSRKGGRQ